jgi:hydrogenase nickel incorporation protein HypA/HybF
MHEYSIVAALVEKVEEIARERNASSVRSLLVRIGELAGVETDLLSTAYDTFRARTICENAHLTIQPVAARWVCPRCANPIPRGSVLQCSRCHVPARLAQGDEIVLERVELEVA